MLILLGSSIPGQKIPQIFQLTPDKLIHCAEYFMLGFLVSRWINSDFRKFSWNKMAVLILLICAACGMLDELYQHLTPNRTPDFYDWCLDFVGATLSIPFFKFWKKKFERVI